MSKRLSQENVPEPKHFRQSSLGDEGRVGHSGDEASAKKRPDLAENVLCQTVSIREGKVDKLLPDACALLNSGGGVLEIKLDFSTSKSPRKEFDTFWQKFEDTLVDMIKPSSYYEIFNRIIENDKVFLFIKAPDHLGTIEYNVCHSFDSKAPKASFHEVLKFLSYEQDCKVPLEKLPSLPEIFKYKDVLKGHESYKIQYTYCESSDVVLDNDNHSQCTDIRKQISTFAKASGGIIVLGVTNDGTVLGHNMNLKENKEDEVEKRLESMINGMTWERGCIPQRKLHWDVKFFPIQDKVNWFVIAIYIAGRKGGVSLKDLPTLSGEMFRNNQKLDLQDQDQLKCIKPSNPLLHNNNRTQREKIQKHTSAFANIRGGIILLGVRDDGTVLGQKMDREENTEEKVEQRVETIIKKMLWGCTPLRGTHWDIKFIPVQGAEDRFVIAIYVAGMKGGVFTTTPKSYELRCGEDGEETPHLLTFDEWKQRMTCGKHMLQIKEEREALKKMTKRFETLSLTKGVLLTLKGSVGGIRESFFKVGAGCPVSPKGFEANLPETAKSVVRKIQEMSSSLSSSSLLVAAPSLHTCIKRGEVPESGVICDLLLFNGQLGGLHLYTLCDTEETNARLLSYSHNTAKVLKKALVVDGGCHEKFYISYHVIPCHEPSSVEISQPRPDKRYPSEYELEEPSEKVQKILESLIIVLAAVPSVLSNKQGICFFNLLTEEQFQLLKQEIDRFKELWIKGVAGTGKTPVAVEFMKELCRRDPSLKEEEILYVCENTGLREQIRKLNVCKALSREDFMLGQKGSENPFSRVKHIVMDGVENFRIESRTGNWLEKARKIVRQHSDDNPGYLWLFIDRYQTNHRSFTGIPDEKEQWPWFRLTKVVRNSERIMEYAITYHRKQNEILDYIEMGHDFPGEGVEVIEKTLYPKIEDLKEIIQSLYSEGYSAGDIAVLFGADSVIPPDLQDILDVGKIVTVAENDSDHLVASSCREFSGLERPVVVLCHIIVAVLSGDKNAIYCCASRAQVKLIDLRMAPPFF